MDIILTHLQTATHVRNLVCGTICVVDRWGKWNDWLGTHKQITDGPKCDKNVFNVYKKIRREYLYEFEMGKGFLLFYFILFKWHYKEKHKGNNRKILQHQHFKLLYEKKL